ncbi:MAG: leucine--tRNA ligase [Patescibacteria group bacterium]|nr:leucine--tRNA ligase [Patescibacteria group bacterium]
MDYEPKKIEQKWQKYWQKNNTFAAIDQTEKEKFYILDMFPYPSGAGLHVGHPRGYTATDFIAKMMQMKGKNVLHPMGWDAFGLPTENYAIKNKVHPEKITTKNIKHFKEQLEIMGLVYDPDREINTTDPNYYKWTQWIFLQLFKKGLAYEAEAPINFCPSCKTGLANEEVENGLCERCHTPVERKKIRQWVLKITAYADRLLEDLDQLDWPQPIKEMQRNWIGKSEGATIKFQIPNSKLQIDVFTTRPDTLFGCTYVVLAPENELINNLKPQIKNWPEVEEYTNDAKNKSELSRIEQKEKTGVKLEGVKAINPVNNEKIPVFVADYVLGDYATGAIMCVPAHDERDFEFAKKFDLPIIEVISKTAKPQQKMEEAYAENGYLINSNEFNEIKNEKAKKKIIKWLKEKNLADFTTTYKLRDWIFSRQRYWGEPIPIVHCEKCGLVPLNEKDLPLKLPHVNHYEPTGTGESPLAGISDWVNTTCPKCDGKAKRETNTMPQWAGSSWYYLRYIDPKNKQKLIDGKKEKYFMPVNLYVGGAEHAVLHLLYARFWHKVLYDLKIVSTLEPFQKLVNVGIILAPDGKKMSKSLGNVINPDALIKKYGADSFRLYEGFIGPFRERLSWDEKGIVGARRFLDRFYNLLKKEDRHENNKKIELKINQLIEKVENDIADFNFNTAISSLMEFVNLAQKNNLNKKEKEIIVKLLAPFAPHLCEEIWQEWGNKTSIFQSYWPKLDKENLRGAEITLIVQINGKTRGSLKIDANSDQKNAENAVEKDTRLSQHLGNNQKIIFVKTPQKPIAILNIIKKV